MKNLRKFFWLVLLMAALLVTACAPQAAGSPNPTAAPAAASAEDPTVAPAAADAAEPTAAPAETAAPEERVTLRLAVSDKQGNDSELPVQEFISQVRTLSDGAIAVYPVWDAGKENQAGFEGRVIELVRSGEADLGVAAARAWSPEGINTFQPLQAPFLIDNEALAQAVAQSDIAGQMLDNLSQSGLTGLTLWLEDLRHPFSLLPDKPILSPADISGRNVRVTDSGTSQKLIETLGGMPISGDGGYDGAESGLRQARTLSGTPTATGNVTFFPKYQVLFANEAAFAKLSEAQQTILREAAAAAQEKAIARHPSEVDAARTWCADVGAVVLASDEQIAAFAEAAQPVLDAIEQDPQNAEFAAAIRDLKAKTPASPAVEACANERAQQMPTPDAGAQTWSAGLPPNGVWQVSLTSDDVMRLGVSKVNAADWAGIHTHSFQDGVWHWTWKGTEGSAVGKTDSCDGTYEVVDDFVRINLSSDCGNEVDDIQWRLDDDGLHIHCIAVQNGMEVEVKASFNAKPYQKIDG